MSNERIQLLNVRPSDLFYDHREELRLVVKRENYLVGTVVTACDLVLLTPDGVILSSRWTPSVMSMCAVVLLSRYRHL